MAPALSAKQAVDQGRQVVEVIQKRLRTHLGHRPAIRPDPESMLVELVVLWAAGVLATSYYIYIRSQASDR
jgi:hypothetical protein